MHEDGLVSSAYKIIVAQKMLRLIYSFFTLNDPPRMIPRDEPHPLTDAPS